jgi:hypothetical protein
METRLVAVIRGRPYYEVLVDQKSVFTGSLSECQRFGALHEEKEIESRRDKRRRDKPEARVYRLWGLASGF